MGQVVDTVGAERKQVYQGKEYDYVFDVDLGDGGPLRKLPYRVTGRRRVYRKTFPPWDETESTLFR